MRNLPGRYKDHAATFGFLVIAGGLRRHGAGARLPTGERAVCQHGRAQARQRTAGPPRRDAPLAGRRAGPARRRQLCRPDDTGIWIPNCASTMRRWRDCSGLRPAKPRNSARSRRSGRSTAGILEPVAGYSGIPYLDSDAAGTQMNADGRTLLAATRGALEFGRVNTPGLSGSDGRHRRGPRARDAVTGAATLRLTHDRRRGLRRPAHRACSPTSSGARRARKARRARPGSRRRKSSARSRKACSCSTATSASARRTPRLCRRCSVATTSTGSPSRTCCAAW